MAQSTDITLANQSGLAFRTELNSILAALSSLQSGSTAPTTTNAYQLWIDTSTTPAQLKIRNGANSAWIVVSSDVTATNLGLAALSGATFTGDVTMNAQSDVRFADSDSSNYVALQGAATIGSNVTFTLPSSDGSANQVLKTDGSGTLSFTDNTGAVTSVGGQTGAVTYATSWAVGTGATAATNTDLDVSGTYAGNVVAVSALDIDCSTGNYFTKTINANSTFTFSNVPASRSFAFVLELTHTSGTVTWPSSVKFPSDTAPTLTTGKTHLFVFETNDGGTRFRATTAVDYVN